MRNDARGRVPESNDQGRNDADGHSLQQSGAGLAVQD
jgi:hypothetical protein